MRIKLFSCLLVFLLVMPLMAAPPGGKSGVGPVSLTVDNTSYIDANRIFMFVTNHGNFGRDLAGVFGYDFGTWFPYTSQSDIANNVNNAGFESPNYATGIWVGAIDSATGEIRVAVSEYSSEYVPGPMANGTFQDDRPEYRVYKLYRDSLASNPNDAYTNWPVDQGAPVVYDSVLGEFVPDMIGDQMLWAVFNDADPDQHEGVDGGETLPLGLEVKQTVFAFDREGSLGNIIFIRERIFNKGDNTLNNCYFSMWCDPDLGDAGDDFVGCDTLLGLGFVYNSANNDSQYGDGPPAMGIDFFQGPLLFTGDPADTGRMWGQLWPEYTNLGMVSFNKYINGTDPDNFGETYGFMRGLTKSGDPYVYDGDTLLYVLSGDPVAGTGDLDIAPADRRWMQTTGPITFRPGDSTEILVAMIVGQGADNLQSITIVKELDAFAQRIYESGFNPPAAPAKPVVTVGEAPNLITLTWNDTSEVDPGDFEFEGYSVWQGETGAGPWHLLATYDLDNHRTDALVDSLVDTETQVKLPVIKRAITNSGLAYHYEATRDEILSTRLFDAQTYYFRVSAFSFSDTLENGETVPIGDRFLENSTVLTVIPQGPKAGNYYSATGLDTLEVLHTTGAPVLSGGQVNPIVMDPELLTGHTYRVIFEDDALLGPVWHLEDVTTGQILLEDQTNQSGDLAYYTVDGMLIEVLGPPLALDDWDWSGETRCITGVNWGGSGFFGGVGVLDEFFVSDLSPADVRIVEVRWVDAGTGQNAYLYDRSNGYAYEGYFPQNIEVWDVTPGSPERQINFSFVENDFAPPHTQRDSVWNPSENLDDVSDPTSFDGLGGREYFMIMASDYSGATEDPTYAVDGWFNGSAPEPQQWDVLFGGWIHQRSSADWGDPRPGDTWTLIPNFINTPADTFTFTAPAPVVSQVESDLDLIKVVPNPYYMVDDYDPGAGDPQVRFHHLPAECTIYIYNLGGDLVRTIVKENDGSAVASWNLKTHNDLPVASGIYIYVVDAPGFGQKIGKMAVFVEAEVLRIF